MLGFTFSSAARAAAISRARAAAAGSSAGAAEGAGATAAGFLSSSGTCEAQPARTAIDKLLAIKLARDNQFNGKAIAPP
ncbi:MAG: hypothetical protein EBW14_18605 [Oxalobacteraceae bacterium]|nr:hypothetical protein [Oxalobacteraceae bacterium]